MAKCFAAAWILLLCVQQQTLGNWKMSNIEYIVLCIKYYTRTYWNQTWDFIIEIKCCRRNLTRPFANVCGVCVSALWPINFDRIDAEVLSSRLHNTSAFAFNHSRTNIDCAGGTSCVRNLFFGVYVALAAIVYIPSVNQTPQSLADHTLTPYQPHIAWHCPKSRPQSTIECHCVWAECRVDYDDGNVTFCLKRVCVCVCGVAMGCLSLLSNSSRSMLFEQAISVQVFSICCG